MENTNNARRKAFNKSPRERLKKERTSFKFQRKSESKIKK